MTERKETVQKCVVIFALYDGQRINLEQRIEPGRKLTGYTIIPGGEIGLNETEEEALSREVFEEYGVEVVKFKKLGVVTDEISKSVVNNGNVYLVSKWKGELSNPEAKNGHIQATLSEARVLCNHPMSQRILDLVDQAIA